MANYCEVQEGRMNQSDQIISDVFDNIALKRFQKILFSEINRDPKKEMLRDERKYNTN